MEIRSIGRSLHPKSTAHILKFEGKATHLKSSKNVGHHISTERGRGKIPLYVPRFVIKEAVET
jgi:hypothetical protein